MSNRLVITAYVPSTESVHQGLCQVTGIASEFRAYEWQGVSQTLLILAFSRRRCLSREIWYPQLHAIEHSQ